MVLVEGVEGRLCAVPLTANDTAIAIGIEILERVIAIVILTRVGDEEFAARERPVTIAVDPTKAFGIEVPLVAADAAVAIVIETKERDQGPIGKPIRAFGVCEIGGRRTSR